MLVKAKLELRNTGCWAEKTARELAAEILVWKCEKHARGVQTWVEIIIEGADLTLLTKRLRGRFLFKDLRFAGDRLFGVVVTDSCTFWPIVTNVTCMVKLHRVRKSGVMEVELVLCGKHTLGRLLKMLRERGVHTRLIGAISRAATGRLTLRQREVLRLALEKGYYDYPRRTGLRDLAKELGVSPSTVAEIIRRAEKKVIANYLG